MPLFLNDHKQGDAIFKIYLLKILSLNKRRFASLGNQILILWMIDTEDFCQERKGMCTLISMECDNTQAF